MFREQFICWRVICIYTFIQFICILLLKDLILWYGKVPRAWGCHHDHGKGPKGGITAWINVNNLLTNCSNSAHTHMLQLETSTAIAKKAVPKGMTLKIFPHSLVPELLY